MKNKYRFLAGCTWLIFGFFLTVNFEGGTIVLSTLLDFIFLSLVLMLVPLILYLFNKNLIENKLGIIICLLNSSGLFFITKIIQMIVLSKLDIYIFSINWLMAGIFYFANLFIFVDRKNNKTKKITKKTLNKLIIISVISVLIVLTSIYIFQYIYINKKYSHSSIYENAFNKLYDIKEISTKEEFLSIKSDKHYSIIVVIYDYCPYCDSLLPIIKDFSNEYQLKSYTLNRDESFFEKLDLNVDGFPYIIIFKDNKLIGSNLGYMERYDYRDFLRQNNVIE